MLGSWSTYSIWVFFGNSRMQIRKKWLNQLKNFFSKHFKEYYLAFLCWSIPSSCENHCTLLYMCGLILSWKSSPSFQRVSLRFLFSVFNLVMVRMGVVRTLRACTLQWTHPSNRRLVVWLWHKSTWYLLGENHGLLNYIDTKAKCRHLKNWPVKALCGRCLSEF